jgi:class 3 adenylate cyclase
MVEQIPNARYEELPGYHYCWFDPEVNARFLALIEEFLTGSKATGPVTRALSTVLFTDIVSSTQTASDRGDKRWRHLLEQPGRQSTELIGRHQGKVVKSTGDGLLATFDGPGSAVSCAHALIGAAQALDIELRAGIHTGEIELRDDGDISGIAVHLASRVESQAQPGEVLVSRTVTDLTIGSDLTFKTRGEHQLKGITGTWELFTALR